MKQQTNHKKILVIVSLEKGRGSGHFVRGSELVRALRKLGCDAALLLRSPAGHLLGEMEAAAASGGLLIEETAVRGMNWDCVIFDRFAVPPAEFAVFYPLAPLIAIDEGGAFRDRFDFVLDLLPNLPSLPAANAARPDLLPLPQKRRGAWGEAGGRLPARILISFGGEDAANMGVQTAAALRGVLPDAHITLVTNRAVNAPLPGTADGADGAAVSVYARVENLRETLADYTAVITHYGLTAFEAVYARCAVLLVSPTPLHDRLAKNAGFLSAGTNGAGLRVLKERGGAADFWRAAERASRAVAERYFEKESRPALSLAEYVHNFDITAFHVCPVCGSPLPSTRKTLARFAEQTFVECPRCSMIAQYRLRPPPIDYNEAYFFEMYQKQYGKTYLEDFPRLKETGKLRLGIIKKLLRRFSGRTGAAGGGRAGASGGGAAGEKGAAAPRILDIGCAYGAFLAAARDEGFMGTGIDISEAAAAYTSGELGIPAFAADFPAAGFPGAGAAGGGRAGANGGGRAGAGGGVSGAAGGSGGSAGEKGAAAPRILDIGCAYGAFLAAARDEGFMGTGIDISEAAAAYTSGELGIPAFAADFPAAGFPGAAGGGAAGGGFDCITMWFVIEHLQDVPAAFTKARELLNADGVFAFSTPSASGVSARKSLKKFLAASPADHWSVWKPAACRRLLARFGFRVKKIRVTGHHPERFPAIGRFASGRGILRAILFAVSKIFRLGDTFEMYAQKTPPPRQEKTADI